MSIISGLDPNNRPVALTIDADGNLKVVLSSAATIGAVTPGTLTQKGYQQITSLAASSSLTVPSGATSAVIQAEGQTVRWRPDATAPTASVGMTLAAGESVFYTSTLADLRFIEAVAGAVLNVAYYE